MDPTPTDLAALIKEVAALRKEVDRWKTRWHGIGRFINYVPEEDGRAAFLRVRCHVLAVEGASPEEDVAIQLRGDEHGGTISLMGRHRGEVARLAADELGGASLVMKDAAGVQRFGLMQDKEQHSCAVVFRPDGKPAVVLKGMEQSASVAVTGPDGLPRGMMISSGKDQGEIALLGTDTGMIAQMKATADGGAFIATRAESEQKAFLGIVQDAPGVVLTQGSNEAQASLLAGPKHSSLRLQRGNNDQPSLTASVDDETARIDGRLADETPGWEAVAMERHAIFELTGPSGDTSTRLHGDENGGSLALMTKTGDSAVLIAAQPDGPVLTMVPAGSSPSEEGFGLLVRPEGTSLVMTHQSVPLVNLIGTPEASALVLQTIDPALPHVELTAQLDGQHVALKGPDEITLAGMVATSFGGAVSLHNDLGILRARLGVVNDGGVMQLNWGGHLAVAGLATEDGGAVVVYGQDGKERAAFTGRELDEEDEDDEASDDEEDEDGEGPK